MPFHVLYDDSAITVCEKPIGLSSEAIEGEESVMSLLAGYYAEKNEACTHYLLHRLDRGVGGLMVFAKTKAAAARLSEDIAAHRFEKCYLAVCSGDLATTVGKEGELCDLLFKDSRKNKVFTVSRKRQGVKEARLRFSLVKTATLEDEIFSLGFVTLITGRTHQVRVQFASRGHSLYGDGKYGSRKKGEIALFSARISFVHPVTKKPMTFSLPMPDREPFLRFKEGTV